MNRIILFFLLAISVRAELVVLTNGRDTYVIERESILSIEPHPVANLYYSKHQGKPIYLDPTFYGMSIRQGLANGNLTPITSLTRISLDKHRAPNTQVAVAGAGNALIGDGGNATVVNQAREVIVNMTVEEVIRQLGIK